MKRAALALLISLACVPALAGEAKTPFQKVLDVLADRHVLDESLDATLARLGGLCRRSAKPDKAQYKNGNVECDPSVGIDSLQISDPLDITFHGKENGDYAKALLLKNFGAHPGHVKQTLKWRPKMEKKDPGQVYAEFEEGKEGRIYVTIGSETDTGDAQD